MSDDDILAMHLQELRRGTVVLACLQQNRARISKGCQQTLTAHGR